MRTILTFLIAMSLGAHLGCGCGLLVGEAEGWKKAHESVEKYGFCELKICTRNQAP